MDAVQKILVGVVVLFAMSAGMPAAKAQDSPMKITVKVVLDKLTEIRQERMRDFEQKVQRYLDDMEWLDSEDVQPFEVSMQLFLEEQPSNIEDRYRCTILMTGSDIRYYDRRAVFPFQEGETIPSDGQFTPLTGLISFYLYLVIANEFDKMGYLEGTPYFDKAKAVMEQGKFTRYFTGWEFREDLIELVYSENYKKFREMKDYFFYGISVQEENEDEARKYIAEAIEKLAVVLENDHDLEAAHQFIDAHHQRVIDLFKDAEDRTPLEILKKLDPDRQDIYDEYL